jgi:hypothetical protein
MPVCHSELGLSGLGTEPLLAFGTANIVGTGPCTLMGLACKLPYVAVGFSVSSHLSFTNVG